MRMLLALAVLIAGVAVAAPARAADLVGGEVTWAGAVRAGSVIILDDQPGVIVRHYWLPPWRNRHYFPTSDKPPVLGRRENLNAPSEAPIPPATFYRAWSTNSLFFPDVLPPLPVHARTLDDEGLARAPARTRPHVNP